MKTELVFIPFPAMGHLISAVEMAKLLINRDANLSIRVLIIKRPNHSQVDSYIESLSPDSNPSLHFVKFSNELSARLAPSGTFLMQLIEVHKDQIRDYLSEIVTSGLVKLSGIIIDMICTTMIDVADGFNIPTYLFFASNAAVLGLMFHFQSLQDDHNQDMAEYKDSDAESVISTFINPVPAKVLPSFVFEKEEGGTWFLNTVRRFRKTKGIVINTFLELESHAVKALTRASEENMNIPPVYAIGPILNVNGGGNGNSENSEMIMKWLDDQPDSSVVFLCFGSFGSFEPDQVKEIAYALERSGKRFLWSLRRPPPKGKEWIFQGEYGDPAEVLPEGFSKRTAERGMVIGWAPQVAVLAHPAVGCFVSHCGWNSTLESVWYGVPMAAWPIYSEQHMNAFQLVKDLGLAAEIKMDYHKDTKTGSSILVPAEQIENAINRQMESQSEIRRKVKEMKEKSRMALVEGGSSYTSVGHFIEDVKKNIS